MDITINPRLLRGTVPAIASKSQAHRLLICAAFADAPTHLLCRTTNRDIEATADCLRALGSKINRTEDGYQIQPIRRLPEKARLECCESGSTLRFLLPVAGALGVDAEFHMGGRLPQRPLSPLWEEMERMGCVFSRPFADVLRCQGQLKKGNYRIDGGVSSQYITGLLFAIALLGDSSLSILGKTESKPYIHMTLDTLKQFGLNIADFQISGMPRLHSPGTISMEGDWSNAAFFLAANALGSSISVTGLNPESVQGDRAIVSTLSDLACGNEIDAADMPDLIPVLAVAAGAGNGGVFHHISRLRLKESDRVQSILDLIHSLGGSAEADSDTLTVFGTGFRGGTVSSAGDHRIAMAAAVAATVCREPVTILGADAVRKSYPGFWEDYRSLGGSYEQHLR